jgi:hypothetical protein
MSLSHFPTKDNADRAAGKMENSGLNFVHFVDLLFTNLCALESFEAKLQNE